MLAERLDQQVRIVEKMYNINNRPKMLDIMGTGFLGKGGYGSAYSIIVKEIKKKGGDPFVSRAMKVCKKLKGNENEIEANLLRKVSHRNIIQLFYFNKIQGEMCLIINLMESDLFYYMKTEYEAGRKLGVYIPMFAHQLFCGLECKLCCRFRSLSVRTRAWPAARPPVCKERPLCRWSHLR